MLVSSNTHFNIHILTQSLWLVNIYMCLIKLDNSHIIREYVKKCRLKYMMLFMIFSLSLLHTFVKNNNNIIFTPHNM